MKIFIKLHIGNDSITCTTEHPFFVNDVWLPAKELKKGGLLSGFKVGAISSADLRYASAHELPMYRIDSIFKFRNDTATKVYNFETKGNNDLYVSSTKCWYIIVILIEKH